MSHRPSHFWLQTLLFVLLTSVVVVTARGQANCGVVDTISYPIDTGVFVLAQDYAAPSERHNGRFHTGEDWYGGRGTSLGQPVRAIAAGRVTYSYPLGWGRDGGVVIIEHTFPDGSTAYSMYGHMAETPNITFPPKFECVQAGQVIGAVGDVRPAPHLHFEIRVGDPDTPGPGYSWEDPDSLGWRDPSKFVANWQAWLNPAYRFHIAGGAEAGPIAPPLVLNDSSVMYFDGATLKRATADGRVLWRANLERRPVAITGFRGTPLVIYADGTIQEFTIDGSPGQVWRVEASFDGPPLVAGESLIFHTSDNTLVALDAQRRNIVWQLPGVPAYVRAYVAGDADTFTIGLITADNEILTLSRSDGIIYRGQLRDVGSFATAPDGGLLAYTRGGLWHIAGDGTWSLAMNGAPPAGHSGAVLPGDIGRIYLFDGTNLYAYNADGGQLWGVGVPGVGGLAELDQIDAVLLLTTTHGDIVAVNDGGRVCGRTRIFGDDRARVWHDLGGDGILRVAVADQIIGLDWTTFIGRCAGS